MPTVYNAIQCPFNIEKSTSQPPGRDTTATGRIRVIRLVSYHLRVVIALSWRGGGVLKGHCGEFGVVGIDSAIVV